MRVYKRVELDHEALSDDVDGLEEYLRTGLVPRSATFSPIEYWLYRCQAKPELARKIRTRLLSIPPMSDARERFFSPGKDLIHYKRSRLLIDVAEACTCLLNWYGKPSPRKIKIRKADKHGNTVAEEQLLEASDDEEQVRNAYSNG